VDPESGRPYEIVSHPAVTGRLELRLVDPPAEQDRVVRLAGHHPAGSVRHGELPVQSNKAPWLDPAGLAGDPRAAFARLGIANPAVYRALQVSDRWYYSYPNDDLRAARRVLPALVRAFFTDLDGRLPSREGLQASCPGRRGRPRFC